MKKLSLALVCAAVAGLAFAQSSGPAPQPGAAQQLVSNQPAPAADTESKVIPRGAKIFIAPMPDGFDTYVAAGIMKKEVPVVLVTDRAKADFELSGISDSERAGWAKMLFLGSQQSNEQASVKVSNISTGVVAWGYAVHKTNSVRGRQSAAEACAKHLKEKIESNK